MCRRVEALGLQGKTRHQMAVELGIHYTTLLTWERLHPEFNEALKAAHDASLAYWQGIVQEAIRGERKEEREEGGPDKQYHRVERYSGSFSRSVVLPGTVNEGEAAAEFNDGVLKVTIPKTEDAKPRKIQIKK